ncbi:MAG: hypothetical protein ACRC7V_04325 [Lachnospiraceae bacterium]
MSLLFKLCMYITSFLPLWISILFIEIMSIIFNSENVVVEYTMIIIVSASFILATTIMLVFLKKKTEEGPEVYTLKKAIKEKGLTLEYLLSYILPLFAFDFTEWKSMVLFLVYFLTLAFLCIRNDNVYANIILEIKKYSFYTCEIEKIDEEGDNQDDKNCKSIVIISKQPLAAKGGNISVVSLNKPFYLEL